MQSHRNLICRLMTMFTLVVPAAPLARGEENYFPTFSDQNTVGLWLFDEIDYPCTTLTDASEYEYDLRLMKGGRLVKGKFGNCLKLTPGLDPAVGYSSWKGMIAFTYMREVSGRPGSGLWGPTVAPEKLLNALDGRDFTCEFWLLLMSNPIQDVVLIDLGDKYESGFKVTLSKRAAGFVLQNAYGGFKATCPTALEQMWGRAWHHVAFTYSSGGKNLRYFIDGRFQADVAVVPVKKTEVPASSWPESLHHTTHGIFEKPKMPERPKKFDITAKPDFEKRRKNRFNFALGQSCNGELNFNGNIDELRFSDVVRYRGDFPLPDSFSRNYRKGAPKPAVASGPPLLFGAEKKYLPNEPVMLGSRKHVFIDEVMIERKLNARLTVNPPGNYVSTNIKIKSGWDSPFFDHDGKVWMVPKGGYAKDVGRNPLVLSEDGINFIKPDLGLIEDEGSKHNNLILTHMPSWGRFFRDTNPGAHPEERFKFTAWVAQRGIYLYVSPDGIHWRRNETCMLPLVSGGGCETFWDDQRGVYVCLIKRDGSYSTGAYPAYGRGATLFETREVAKAWPFKAVPNPYYEGWAFPAVTGEGITVFGPDIFDPDKGQVFRTRATKYPWAPDTYVAFLVRNAQIELAVSRDGINWHVYDQDGDRPYMQRGRGGWIHDGLVLRGDEIWQYINRGNKNVARVSQRLDGFVSLDAGGKTATIITRPLVFEGSKLTLNVAAKGTVRVGILSLPARSIDGFAISDCDPIEADSVRHVVTWKDNPDVGKLAGQVVRLRFEMQDAKLYGFRFEE
ncbi:MAG: LamG-like jellyroll fold domain-containing protein [Planctomycetota bacterium]